MTYHYHTFLEIQFFNEKDANKFFDNIELEDDVVYFQTNDFFIDTTNGYFEGDSESVLIIGESHSKSIGGGNVREFFNEIETIGKNIGIDVKNIYLRFYSYDDSEEGYTIFIRNLEKAAAEKFIRDNMIDEFGENYKDETDEDAKEAIIEHENDLKEYSKGPWVICCGEFELQEAIENDKDGRENPFDFDEEVFIWSKNIIDKWEFPWEEGCSMWAAALDDEGDFLWDNQ